jgi:hypothetical protein
MNWYQELGIRADASPEEIRKAHHGLTRLLHPDRQPSKELRHLATTQMQRINEIAATLLDPASRSRYDASLLPALPVQVRSQFPRQAPMFALIVVAACILTAVASWYLADGHVHVRPPGSVAAISPRPRLDPLPPQSSKTRVASSEVSPEIRDRSVPATRPVLAEAVRQPVIQNGTPIQAREPAPFTLSPPDIALLELPALPLSVPVPAATNPYPGLWVYANSGPSRDEAKVRTYAPEFIELRIRNCGDMLCGAYRARYRIPDRPISPDVSFTFQGPLSANPKTLPWRAGDGSQGTVDLKITGPDALQVDWRVTSFGAHLALGSGVAVLARTE